ncbi:MAG: hypothetical protein U0Y10_04550 [Spirosomataceae bacterium]
MSNSNENIVKERLRASLQGIETKIIEELLNTCLKSEDIDKIETLLRNVSTSKSKTPIEELLKEYVRIADPIEDVVNTYRKIFIEASQSMQMVNYNWDKLIEVYFPKLHIIYGFFTELDPITKKKEYFILPENGEIQEFSKCIPYFEKRDRVNKKLFKSLIENSEKEFDTIIKSPKVYHYLPVQDGLTNENGHLNSIIPIEVVKGNDYYIVLYDEIVFFQCAFNFFNKDRDWFAKAKHKETLKYLLKYALSVEAKISEKKLLHDFLESESYKIDPTYWNTEFEYSIRIQINHYVDMSSRNDKKNNKLKELFEGIMQDLITYYRRIDYYKNTPENDIDLIRHVARFDIDSVLPPRERCQK